MQHTVNLHKFAETTDVAVVEEWNVAVGDTVAVDQSLASLETDKVTVEFPSPVAGVVTEILVGAGDEARTGDPMIVIEG